MRAHEIMENLDSSTETMMLKLRKDSAATLNAKTLQGIFGVIEGWKMEVIKDFRPSDGGWIMKETPFGKLAYNARMNSSARIVKGTDRLSIGETYRPDDKDLNDMSDHYKIGFRLDFLKNQYLPLLQEAAKLTKGRYRVEDIKVSDEASPSLYDADDFSGGLKRYSISYKLMVQCNVTVITSPDGQTYEVFGDYKNGALNPQTYVTFFEWAKEHTDFMGQVLTALNMEAIPPKEDPKAPYTPPHTASEELHRVLNIMNGVIEGVKPALIKELFEDIEAGVSHLAKAVAEGADEKRIRSLKAGHMGWVGRMHASDVTAKSGAMAYCKEAIEGMCNEFVRKNTLKLAPIMTAKGNYKAHKVNHVTLYGGLTTNFDFSFEDGSSFNVVNKCVTSYMPNMQRTAYTPYYRFPTTFHNVVMPDGSKMPSPSEERMNEVFCAS